MAGETAITGVDVIVKVHSVQGSEAEIFGQRGATLSFKRDMINMSTRATFPARPKKPGGYDWTVDTDGLLHISGDMTGDDVMKYAIDGTEVYVHFEVSGSCIYEGTAYISGLDLDGSKADEEATYKCTLSGNGALAYPS